MESLLAGSSLTRPLHFGDVVIRHLGRNEYYVVFFRPYQKKKKRVSIKSHASFSLLYSEERKRDFCFIFQLAA